jgi:hypothetical protein
MRAWIVWLIALTWSSAVAASPLFPPDAEVFLTAESGTIVGVGSFTAGRTFEIRILRDFSGPARLTLVARGEVSVVDVVVRGPGPRLPDGGFAAPLGDLLLADGTSVFASLRAGGVVIEFVWSEPSIAGDRAPDGGGRAPGDDGREPGIEGSNASDTGRDNANPRASEGGNPRSGEENPGRKP